MSYIPDVDRYGHMEYRNCGNSGLKLPAISLGTWHNFGSEDNFENMRAMCLGAFESGITAFDIANTYGRPLMGSAESNIGRIIKEELSAHRDELIISTKAGYRMWPGPYGDGGSRKYLISSIDQSLTRLGLDYVDIFYHHRPDPETPLEETMGALADIVKSGKALYVGLSNYQGDDMRRATKLLDGLGCPFVVNQNRYSIFDRAVEENGLLSAAREEKKGLVVFSPLAQGLLTDRYLHGIPEDSRVRMNGFSLKESAITQEKVEKARALAEIADGRGQSLAQMALSWLLSKPEVTSVIIGASRPVQIIENAAAIESPALTEEELRLIDGIALG